MKKLIVLAVLFFAVCGMVSADLCTDSDDARDYDRKGKVKYGVTEEWDRCVMGPEADVRIETGTYLKEYFCDKDDKRTSEIVSCPAKGFERCYDGACVGGTSATNTSSNTTSALPELPVCGDKKINQQGEECDPPGKICYTDSFDIGLCNDACKCDVKLKATPKQNTTNATQNTTQTTTQNATQPAVSDETKTPTPVIPSKEQTPPAEEPPENEPEATVPETIEKPKPKGFFSAIWAWLAGLFS